MRKVIKVDSKKGDSVESWLAGKSPSKGEEPVYNLAGLDSHMKSNSVKANKVLSLLERLAAPGNISFDSIRECLVLLRPLVQGSTDAAHAFVYGVPKNWTENGAGAQYSSAMLPLMRQAKAEMAGLRWCTQFLMRASEMVKSLESGKAGSPGNVVTCNVYSEVALVVQFMEELAECGTVAKEVLLSKPWGDGCMYAPSDISVPLIEILKSLTRSGMKTIVMDPNGICSVMTGQDPSAKAKLTLYLKCHKLASLLGLE